MTDSEATDGMDRVDSHRGVAGTARAEQDGQATAAEPGSTRQPRNLPRDDQSSSDSPASPPELPAVLTLRRVAEIRRRLCEGWLLFRLDDEGIARHFAHLLLGIPAWNCDLAALRATLSKVRGWPPNMPPAEEEFAAWVRKSILEFDKLPRDELARLFQEASEDLGAIASNIRFCEEEIAKVKREKGDGAPRLQLLAYYERMNQAARDEIVVMLSSPENLQNEALYASYKRWRDMPLDFHVPWSFRWYPEGYDPSEHSPIRHSFGHLPVVEIRRIEAMYREQRWPEFDAALERYISTHNPARAIGSLLAEHHLLAAREQLLTPALAAFNRGEHHLFISAVAVQIEGIFEDACHQAGVTPEALRSASIVPKLESLKGHVLFDYVYYAFDFPVLRNHVAHGRIPTSDVLRTARMLLLDLWDACETVANQSDAPSTRLVSFLRAHTLPLASPIEVAEFALHYIANEGRPPNPFYGLGDAFYMAELALDGAPLWDWLLELVPRADEEGLSDGIRYLASKLGKARTNLRERSRNVLAHLPAPREENFDPRTFLALMKTVAARGERKG